MGDISEYRGLIVAGTFLTVLVLLLGWIPYEYMTLAEYRTIEVPEYFDAVDLQMFSEMYNATFDYSHGYSYPYLYNAWRSFDKTLGGWDLRFHYENSSGKFLFAIEHLEKWFIFGTGGHGQVFYDQNGASISPVGYYGGSTDSPYYSEDTLTTYWDSARNLVNLKSKCDHFSLFVYISYDASSYSSISEAANTGGLAILVGINFDQVNTSYNSWDLISRIIFLNIPVEVPLYLRLLIAIPIWIAVAYIAVIMIMRAIGAIFGGGA